MVTVWPSECDDGEVQKETTGGVLSVTCNEAYVEILMKTLEEVIKKEMTSLMNPKQMVRIKKRD